MTDKTRKPSPAQRRELLSAIGDTGSEEGKIRVGISERTRNVMIEAGWIEERDTTGLYTSRDFVTRDGYLAAGYGDMFAMPDVKVGDVLEYVTHPGCTVRVTRVRDGGRIFDATYVTMCGVCRDDGGDPTVPSADPIRPSGLGVWPTPAYLVRPVTPTGDADEPVHLRDRFVTPGITCGATGPVRVTRRLSKTTCPRCLYDGDPSGSTRKMAFEAAHSEALGIDPDADARWRAEITRFIDGGPECISYGPNGPEHKPCNSTDGHAKACPRKAHLRGSQRDWVHGEALAEDAAHRARPQFPVCAAESFAAPHEFVDDPERIATEPDYPDGYELCGRPRSDSVHDSYVVTSAAERQAFINAYPVGQPLHGGGRPVVGYSVITSEVLTDDDQWHTVDRPAPGGAPQVPADLDDDAAWSAYVAGLPEPTPTEIARTATEFDPAAHTRAHGVAVAIDRKVDRDRRTAAVEAVADGRLSPMSSGWIAEPKTTSDMLISRATLGLQAAVYAMGVDVLAGELTGDDVSLLLRAVAASGYPADRVAAVTAKLTAILDRQLDDAFGAGA